MALVLKDRVQESGTANTTVSFTLTGAVTSYQSFSAIGNTNTTYYAATDNSGNWEAGLGTYSTTGPTLTRTTILSSSNAGSAVTFSGTVTVFCTYPSSRALYLDGTSANINVSQAAFTANGIPYASSTSALATGSALTFDGTNFVTTGNSTARAFIPSNSTVPTNGLFLPAANTIGFSTNTTEVMRIDSTGQVGIGVTPQAGRNLTLSKTLTGSVGSYAQLNAGNIQSDVTTAAYYFSSFANTATANFALGQITHYATSGSSTFPNVTAGGSVGSQYGFAAESHLIGATNNYGFYGNIASGTGRYNLYMNGTANNYMAGRLGIGSTSLTDRVLSIGNAITGATNSLGIAVSSTISSDVTASARIFQSSPSTQAASFTLGALQHYTANQATIGAGSTVTNQYGFLAESTLTGATNNYGFYGNIAAAANRWNFYAGGTADNYLAGALGLNGSTTPAARLHIGTTALSSAAWTTSGLDLRIDAVTLTSSAGLTGTVVSNSIAQPTFAATTVTQTVTNAATLYIANAPAAGTNVTITNAYALYVAGGSSFMAGPLLVGAGASGITFSTGIKSLLGVGAASVAYTDQSNNYGTGPSIFTNSTTFNYPNAPDSATNAYANYLSPVTFNGNGVNGTTWNFASTLHIAGAPSSSTGAITTGYALSIGNSGSADGGIYINVAADVYGLNVVTGLAGFGGKVQFSNTTGDKLTVTGNSTRAAWTTTGAAISVDLGTYTSNAGLTGTVVANSIAQPTFAATTASQTVTNAATLYIAAAPSAGSNVTITNPYALYVAAGASYFSGSITCNSNIKLAAGTATVAPLTFTSGTSLTSPVAGTFEFDGSTFFTTDDVTDGRGYVPSVHFFRLTSDGSAITTIANFFGTTSGMSLDANIFYEVEAYLYFTKTTAGTATFTMTFTQAPVNNNALYVGTPVGGVGTAGTAQTAALVKSTATAGALPATGSLTTAVNHEYVLQSMFQANATTGGTLNLQVTSSAGSITPLTGSYYKITRLPAANTGAFV